MAIKPISLPSAAGINFSGLDTRHFSLGDAVNVPGLSNPTRNLAERDNALASKMNEVVEVVNNQEQFVPLPIVRTNVPPNEEVVVMNYRIPAGFEARVLNAIIGTTPSSTSAEVDVYYTDSFGGSAGTAVVTATPGSEFSGDVNFYQTGEFIIVLKNTGASTLEIAASVMLTMRPVGAEGTLLVGSVIEGEQGPPGMRGPVGLTGASGAGIPGSPGMIWQGAWTNGNTYQPNDVVSYNYSGTQGAWIARTANIASSGVNDPQVDAVTWNYVAYGFVGATGASSGATVPTYNSATADLALVTGTDWLSLAINGYSDSGVTIPGNPYTITVKQHYVQSLTGSPKGFAWLHGSWRAAFRGSGTITLPKIAGGAKLDYTNSYIDITAVANGTVLTEVLASGTGARICTSIPVSTDQYVIKVLNNNPVWVDLTVSGQQPIP